MVRIDFPHGFIDKSKICRAERLKNVGMVGNNKGIYFITEQIHDNSIAGDPAHGHDVFLFHLFEQIEHFVGHHAA